jgi:hypothetical protein
MTDDRLEWLPNILALAEKVANGSLEADWIKESRNPALSVDMLKAEVFESLLSDEARWVMRRELMAAPSLVEALELFLHCLRNVAVAPAANRQRRFPGLFTRRDRPVREFLNSANWLELRELAGTVTSTARESGLSTQRIDR